MVEKYREMEDRKLEVPRAINALKRASLELFGYRNIPEVKKVLDSINSSIILLHNKKEE